MVDGEADQAVTTLMKIPRLLQPSIYYNTEPEAEIFSAADNLI
jgi:hypothetical protein